MVAHMALELGMLGFKPHLSVTLLTDFNFSVPQFPYLQNGINMCKALRTVPVNKVSHHHPYPDSLYMKVTVTLSKT